MLVFTSCVHHFLAVNYQRVYRKLRADYPDIDFIDCYMDPIMRRTLPAVPHLWQQIHRLLPKEEEKLACQVNLVGNCFRYGPYSDVNALLARCGIRVMDVNTCADYDEFREMGKSICNVTFHKTAVRAAKDMEIRLGQKWIPMRPGYTYPAIREDLQALSSFLQIPCFSEEEFREEEEKTEEAVRLCREYLGETPVSIDYTAVDEPLALAVYLLEHGFNVESVFVDVFTEEEAVFKKLQAMAPDLKIYQSLGWNIRLMERSHEGKVVAIGQKSAYFLDTNYFVNLVENEGMYGFRGIRRLMELLTDACIEEKPMKELVQIKGWGCSCS